MDLISDKPFWLLKDGLLADYPALNRDITCEVAVIGAGITGALVASRLIEAGVDTVVMDRRDVGQGSTCATTGLIQYEIDTHLCDLAKLIGQESAEHAYTVCLEALGTLESWVSRLPDPCGFAKKDSLYLASTKRDVDQLREEASARRTCGIDAVFLGADELNQRFSIPAPGAILSSQAAQVDAFRLTHFTLQSDIRRGLQVFDRTEVTKLKQHPDGLELRTNRGFRVSARKVIFATGYESESYLKRRVSRVRSTYAIVTQPIPNLDGWPSRCLLWESSRPYVYVRTTDDGRILVGGEDDRFHHPLRRDVKIPRKSRKLLKRLRTLLPSPDVEAEYCWAGAFAETKDGLAYIGSCEECPNAYFALGFGGNGITFGVIAAEIMRDLYCGRANPHQYLFRFGR